MIVVSINTVQHSTVRRSKVQYSTVQYSTVQYSTVQYMTLKDFKIRLKEEEGEDRTEIEQDRKGQDKTRQEIKPWQSSVLRRVGYTQWQHERQEHCSTYYKQRREGKVRNCETYASPSMDLKSLTIAMPNPAKL